MDTLRHDHRPEPPRIGPGVLLVPLLVLALALVYSRNRFGAPQGDHARPPTQEIEDGVPGWAGSVDASEGRLIARLAPLHSDPVRQRFDTLALGRRFGRDQGAPWRLVLSLTGQTRAGSPGLDLDDIVVVDVDGLALEPVLEPVWPNQVGVLDPVSVLFAPPPGQLFPGEEISLVLWGRIPEEGARVSGLGDNGGVPLHAERVPREGFSRSLARLDRARDEARAGADQEKR